MPTIRCYYEDCVNLEGGYCGAVSIELDPEGGCLTYESTVPDSETEEWNEEELGDLWHDDEEILYEDADDAEWYTDEDFD